MNDIQKLHVYLKKALKAVIAKPNWNTFKGTIVYFPSWKKYLLNHISSFQPIPWFSFNAINYLKEVIRSEMIVFEFGSGGSTLFWANQVSKVISLEHDPEWHQKMTYEFQNNKIKNIEYHLVTPDPDHDFKQKNTANPEDYISKDNKYNGKKFESYVRKIDIFPDEYFDIVVVDGRARPSCIAHAVNKIKNGGFLILDNSERKYYLPSLKRFTRNWKRFDFLGPVPYSYDFSQTSILKKPD